MRACLLHGVFELQPIKGVKSESVLSTHINIMDHAAVPVHYMHAVHEGVVKKLIIEFWTGTKHHSKRSKHLRMRSTSVSYIYV